MSVSTTLATATFAEQPLVWLGIIFLLLLMAVAILVFILQQLKDWRDTAPQRAEAAYLRRAMRQFAAEKRARDVFEKKAERIAKRALRDAVLQARAEEILKNTLARDHESNK